MQAIELVLELLGFVGAPLHLDARPPQGAGGIGHEVGQRRAFDPQQFSEQGVLVTELLQFGCYGLAAVHAMPSAAAASAAGTAAAGNWSRAASTASMSR